MVELANKRNCQLLNSNKDASAETELFGEREHE